MTQIVLLDKEIQNIMINKHLNYDFNGKNSFTVIKYNTYTYLQRFCTSGKIKHEDKSLKQILTFQNNIFITIMCVTLLSNKISITLFL